MAPLVHSHSMPYSFLTASAATQKLMCEVLTPQSFHCDRQQGAVPKHGLCAGLRPCTVGTASLHLCTKLKLVCEVCVALPGAKQFLHQTFRLAGCVKTGTGSLWCNLGSCSAIWLAAPVQSRSRAGASANSFLRIGGNYGMAWHHKFTNISQTQSQFKAQPAFVMKHIDRTMAMCTMGVDGLRPTA